MQRVDGLLRLRPYLILDGDDTDDPSIVDDVQYMVTAAISALSLPLIFRP
jgi:hypothetical protein